MNSQIKTEFLDYTDGGETFEARAVITAGEDRDRLFASVCAALPPFAEYQARTERNIPVIELKRR